MSCFEDVTETLFLLYVCVCVYFEATLQQQLLQIKLSVLDHRICRSCGGRRTMMCSVWILGTSLLTTVFRFLTAAVYYLATVLKCQRGAWSLIDGSSLHHHVMY